tara:strand:- start:25589 stop:26683 length:1095 start_codon:yes stop_codon:yes gene_type:complete
MSIDTVVRPISDVRCGIHSEANFGQGGDNDGTDGQAYRQLPMLQVTKPTFNISRESRLLSGRGLVRHKNDTIINARGGTVTMPFDFVATPTLLAQHITCVTQEHSEGSSVHTSQVGGQGSEVAQVGGSVSSGLPHTLNIAYSPQSSGGTRIAGGIVSDLSISGDYGTNGGYVNCSGNYFSGFSNPLAGATSLETDFTHANWTSVENTTFLNMGNMATKTLTVEGNAAQDLVLKSFNIDIANGVNRVGWNTNGDAECYALPEYAVTGSITIKMDENFDYTAGTNVIQDFLDGDTLKLILEFGSGINAAGEAKFTVNCQYTGDPAQDISENGIFHTLAFEGVDAGTSSGDEAFKSEIYSSEAIADW